jgi:hypothetical protein
MVQDDEKAKTTKASSKLMKAVTGPINMAVVGAAAVGALALHSWPVVALGGAAYAALVAWDFVSGNDKKSARERRATLPNPARLKDPATRSSVTAITSAQAELSRVLEDTPEDVKTTLALALQSAEELGSRAALLADRSEQLGKYLVTIDPRVLEQDVAQLRQRVATSKDPETKAQYDTARKAREEHLAVILELRHAKERVNASLLGIAATLAGLPAKIVRMRALDAAAMDEISGSVKEDLDRMNGELTTLEETLASLAEAGQEMRSP